LCYEKIFVYLQQNYLIKKDVIMSHEERKAQMADNREVNSKKPSRSRFMRWARAHKGAFVVIDPELKSQLVSFE
jgi:hypothetical protein